MQDNQLPDTGFRLTEEPIEILSSDLSPGLIRSHPQTGGIVTFEGRVRNHHQGRAVLRLSYSAYELLAGNEGQDIAREAKERFGLDWAWIIHRTGDLSVGEMAVWISAASPHRQEAFAACRFMIDEVKHRLPVWKHEYYEDGSHEWVYCAHHT
ncbi:molybdenum cofactor biosynthesis protein MoaE [Spirochaeta lutea]|uniref:Molybdopterin synthase catalytic subunit n=1 Tax=Spirochaeta lutea TaxID=1480694 RepID=A0A098QWX4_9SPIO|nr:molybdenum cofactor biosynthesis protein MoaE [Spirochaeta lutea]KGE70997.1 hypothetical protein DC28_13815 [Spirochaeta lutea]